MTLDQLLVEDYLQDHTIYDLFKCGICGKQWSDHTSDCFYHDHKERFDELRQIASSMDKYKSVFEMARRNGYREDCYTSGGIRLHSENDHHFITGMTVKDSNGHVL